MRRFPMKILLSFVAGALLGALLMFMVFAATEANRQPNLMEQQQTALWAVGKYLATDRVAGTSTAAAIIAQTLTPTPQ
jgi:hypothetical protein